MGDAVATPALFAGNGQGHSILKNWPSPKS